MQEGCIGDAWLISGDIEANSVFKAIKIFKEKLNDLISIVVFVGQAYGESNEESFVVSKGGSDVALLYYIRNRSSVGLSFDVDEFNVVNDLLSIHSFRAFFLYWKDATNAFGYSEKLLLMLSAIESLCKDIGRTQVKDWKEVRKDILGQELDRKLFESGNKGLRHRLTHGEYFLESDGKDFVDALHRKIIDYFNDEILKEHKIRTEVRNPQRHPFGNKEYGYWFIRNKNVPGMFLLRDILENFDASFGKSEDELSYQIVHDCEMERLKMAY